MGKKRTFTNLFQNLCVLQLRLMYEAIPMAFLVEQAGGLASNGNKRILDIQPEQIHQRTPVFLGSKHDVEDLLSVIKKHSH